MKANVLFAGFNLGHICSGKKRQTNARFMDDALKIRGIK